MTQPHEHGNYDDIEPYADLSQHDPDQNVWVFNDDGTYREMTVREVLEEENEQ